MAVLRATQISVKCFVQGNQEQYAKFKLNRASAAGLVLVTSAGFVYIDIIILYITGLARDQVRQYVLN